MATKKSAGILLYHLLGGKLSFFLVHPGGPFFAKKDEGAWTIPKGEFEEDEDAFRAAQREFEEETGMKIEGNFIALTPIRQKSGKWVHAWAVEGNIDAATIKSNLFEMEWPPRSGKKQQFPEIDRGEWYTTTAAKQKINPSQVAFIDELLHKINS